ncbi:MAG TPA: sulfite exporter TauE/SafE family protein [Acidimicrobiales bacterium]|nr:sulfite exporter TauE/SafE family protein [Acidimicrobiales bacterium]
MLIAVSGAWREAFLAFAGLGAGLVNGVAGGGTLVSFPVLLALGLPAIRANVTSTIGIWPGYLGGVAGFRREIGDQLDRLRELAPVAAAGGVAGAVLLLVTPSDAFSRAAPYLVLLACVLFALQPVLAKRLAEAPGTQRRFLAQSGTFVACVYGAYFGAGLGVLLLAILGIAIPDRLIRTSGLRSMLSLGVNTIAAIAFAVAAHVAWSDAGVLAVTSLVGGYAGARFVRRVPAGPLRVLIILIGLAAAARLIAG